jgi:hypothetical protein
MLARQSWRLLQFPESLCARVLCAKYFPDGDLLSAKPQPGISYVWRSILKGLEVLKEGIIWRIGDGSRIRIWEDPWFPKGSTRQPSTYKGNCELEMVADLIDHTTLAWNHQLIAQHFHVDDIPIILSIPIRADSEDFVAWHFDEKGQFSVKSAYKVHVEMERKSAIRQEGQGSNHFQLNMRFLNKSGRFNVHRRYTISCGGLHTIVIPYI